MQLLTMNSLTRTGSRIWPLSLKIDLMERTSTITATALGSSVPKLGSWLITDEGPTAGMVWRVRDTDDQHIGAGKYTITAESILSVLKGKIIEDKVTAADITGNKKDTTCTAKQAIQYLLKKQDKKDFTLGTIDYTDSNPYSFSGDNLYSALETITGSLEDAYWEVSFNSYPFKISIKKLSESDWSEMRLNRNITGVIKKQQSISNMYTAFMPVGKNNLKLPEVWLTRNVDKYGRIEKTETDQSMDTVAKLRAWGKEKLRNHAKPPATITLTGRYLAEVTGEKLDKIRLNRVCKVPIDGESTIAERVIRLSWADWIKEPESMNVTLCNQENDVASIIKEMVKSGGRSSRQAAEDAQEDHAWFEDTTEHVAMVAETIIGKNKDGVDWKRVSELKVGPDGIHGTVDKIEGDVKKIGTRFDQDEKKIGMVVGTYPDGKNFVKAGEICLAINESGESEAMISANKIYLLGDTIAKKITAEYISAKIATIPNLNGLAATFSGNVTVKTALFSQYYYLGTGVPYRNLADGISEVRINGPTSNSYKLQYKTWNQQEWQDAGSFSRAIASWTVGWSNGKWTATASPQNQECWTEIMGGTPVWTGRTVEIPIMAVDNTDYYNQKNTGRSVSATFTMAKADMDLTRSSRYSTEPSADGTITNLPVVQDGWWIFTMTAAGTTKTYKMKIDYSVQKSDMDLTRSSRYSSEPSADGTITNLPVTQSGWWVFTMTAAGTTKSYKMKIDYSVSKSQMDLDRSSRYSSEPSADGTISNLSVTQSGWYIFTMDVAGTTKTYKLRISYSVSKSSIDLTRSARYEEEPSTDGTITNLPVVQSGWWVFTVTVGGTSKTFKLRITV